MSSDFTLTLHSDYLEVNQSPDFVITPESVGRVWKAVIDAYNEHGCRRVLVEGPVLGRKMEMMDAYESGSILDKGKLYGLRVAFCLQGYHPDQISEFFTTVAKNRGFLIRFFEDKTEALQWLGTNSGE